MLYGGNIKNASWYRGHGIIVFIFFCGLVFRVYNLGKIPVGIHGDEASIGYNAYSLLMTGNDQNGNRFPLTIDQFGDFRPAGYHYLDIPFVAVLGLSAWATRLPSALFGAASILALYVLVWELFQKKSVALVSAWFLAFSPWHIIISRATSEGVVASFFIIMGMWAILRFRLVYSFIFFFLSFLFYHSARIFVPLFFVVWGTGSIGLGTLSKKTGKWLGVFCLLLFLSLALVMVGGKGIARPSSVSIFNIPGGETEIYRQIGEDGIQNPLITRFLHNKALFYGRLFLRSYFGHLSGEFLFTSMGNPLRYNVPWSSVMYLADLPFLILGASFLLSDAIRTKKYRYFFVLLWLGIGIIPAGLTYEDLPNVQRASLAIPALVMIAAWGMVHFFSFVRQFRWKFVWGAFFGMCFLYGYLVFFHNYFYHNPRHEPWHRSAAIEELVLTVNSLTETYKQVVVTTEGNNNVIFYLFYPGFDPKKFQEMGSPREHDGLEFERVVFRSQKCPLGVDSANPVSEDPNIIFVNKADCRTPVNTEMLSTIRHPDGTPAYFVLKVDPFWNLKQQQKEDK